MMETLVWIGFAQGLFAAILMFTKKEQSISDKILSGWIMLLAIEFLTCGFDYKIYNGPLLSSSFLLFNPALFLYVRSLTEKNFKLKWVQLLHLLPYVIFETYAYVMGIPFTLNGFFHMDSTFYFRMIFSVTTFFSWAIYNPWSVYLITRHRLKLQNQKSNIDPNENLDWIMSVTGYYVLYCFTVLIIGVVVYFTHSDSMIPHVYNYAALLFLVYMISFYGLRQQKVEIPAEPEEEEVEMAYKNSTLTAETKNAIREKIIHYFEKEKAYLNPELNMDLLSSAINYPKYQITEVLNSDIGKNFFQFVNSYRVEAVTKMLLDPKLVYSIEAIGYECGFNSKSSFYTVFKNLTGETPISFRKKHLV